MPSLSPLPLHIVPNHGSESMGYLTAILDHWEHLPDLMLFLHGHRQSWHTFALGSDFALRRLAKLPPRNLSAGFMQLGCLEVRGAAGHYQYRHWGKGALREGGAHALSIQNCRQC